MSNIIVPPPWAEPVSFAVSVIILEMRLQKGWPPIKLAVAARISRQGLRLIETHRAAPRLDTTARLAAAFGRTTASLIEEAEERLP